MTILYTCIFVLWLFSFSISILNTLNCNHSTIFIREKKVGFHLHPAEDHVQYGYPVNPIRIENIKERTEEIHMKISTKGRYALRMMLEFAMHPQECTKISQVAQRQQISVKYLEQIVTVLCKAGYVKSMRGAQGGYRLSRDAADYTVGEILRLTEGSLSPVACLEDEKNLCKRADSCATLGIWKQLEDAISNVVDHATLADLVEEQKKKEQVKKEQVRKETENSHA